MRDIESVEIVVDLTPPAVSQVQDTRCANGNLCGMKTPPLTIEGHVYLTRHKKVHVCLCGSLRDERGNGCRVRLEDLSEQGHSNTALVGALICFGCMGMWLHFYKENS